MALQDGKLRRKSLVYGKVKRSTSAYNVFNLDDVLGGDAQGRSNAKLVERTMGQQTMNGQRVIKAEKSSPAELISVHQRLTPKQKPSDSNLSMPWEFGTRDGRSQSTSAFDLPLSDEEDGAMLFVKSMQKRRRLTPVRSQSSTVKSCERSPSLSDANENNHQQSQSNCARTTLQPHAKTLSGSRALQRSARRARTPVREEYELPHQALSYNTPNQTRLLSSLVHSPVPTDSPSKISLTSLNLANGEVSDPEASQPNLESTAGSKPIRRSLSKPKKRLIDAMASPRKSSSIPASPESRSEESALKTLASSCRTNQPGNQVQLGPVSSAEEVNGTGQTEDQAPKDASTSLKTSSRPRVTYSRERSHLADMLEEDILGSASQSGSQTDSLLLSQNDIMFNSFDSAHSHGAPDDELEQEISGIRSIHELRHSGGNARCQVDLESILEEIEAEGSPARSRRLRGLAQLIDKVNGDEARRHILDQSLDRLLSRCPQLKGDVVGQTLLVMLLSRLTISEHLSSTSLKAIFDAIVLSKWDLLQESREFALIVRDRKQNLSKAACREIVALVGPFCASVAWPIRHPKAPSPQLIYVNSLDLVLRQLRQLGDFETVLPASIFTQLVDLLLEIAPTELIDGKAKDCVLVLESAISVIESLTISRNWPEYGCFEIAKKLCGLGPILAQLTVSELPTSGRTQHLILRLILNITNNDSGLCDAFSDPALISAIFGIVKRDFLGRPMLIDTVLDGSKMEGVILALGALSNLAEHSNLFRQAMVGSSLDGRTMVDWITLAFRDQVELASEASSVEQTISLVAFGYLSVLLCNLCLDSQIRNHVRGLLKGGTLHQLLLFVQEFLDHFRRAEEVEARAETDREEMKSGFVDRFGAVLDALRQAEGSC